MRATDFFQCRAIEIFRERLQIARGDFDDKTDSAYKNITPINYDVTLVGHSMGTMVLNGRCGGINKEAAGRDTTTSSTWRPRVRVRDFSRRSGAVSRAENKQTQFYNLMLHPLADLRERGQRFMTFRRGSLLEGVAG